MIMGVGIDLVHVGTIRRYMGDVCGSIAAPTKTTALSPDGGKAASGAADHSASAFIRRTFTSAERDYADGRPDPAETYAGLFAVKEAVTKAISAYQRGNAFDMRKIETLHREDGTPYVHMVDPLLSYCRAAGIASLAVSISNEDDYATAICVAQDEPLPLDAG